MTRGALAIPGGGVGMPYIPLSGLVLNDLNEFMVPADGNVHAKT